MHELPVTESILHIALETARQHGGGRVTAIHLVIGDLTSIVDDSVQFYFDILSKDTPAAGATLHIRRVTPTGTCGACGRIFPAQIPLSPVCPLCGGGPVQVQGGREFYVESIQVTEHPSDTHHLSDEETI